MDGNWLQFPSMPLPQLQACVANLHCPFWCGTSMLVLPTWCLPACSLFKVQARYIAERMDSDLWTKVLDENNQFRRQLIDQASSFDGLRCGLDCH